MSKVSIEGNISGTGTFTIAAPNSNSNYTMTLPAASGTLATVETAGFPSGTVMLFVQTSAPTGWTKSTSHDDKALRVVSGTASSGGSAAFTTAFGTPSVSGSLSGTVGATTLTTTQMPSHNHQEVAGSWSDSNGSGKAVLSTNGSGTLVSYNTSHYTVAAGGGGSHNHSFSGSLSSATATINVAYVDTIIATKD